VGIIAGLLLDKLSSRRIELLRHPYQVEGLHRCSRFGKRQDTRSHSNYASSDCRSQHGIHCAPDNIFLNNLAKSYPAKRKPCWTPFQTNRNDMVSHYLKSHDKAQGDEPHQLAFPHYRRIRRPKVFRMRAYLTVLLPYIFAGNIYIMSTSISCPLIRIELEALGDLM
jgi:hypothetical protein